MKVNDLTIPLTMFSAFADSHGLTMEVRERTGDLGRGHSRYYAHFTDAETKDGGCLVGTFGNGATKDSAIADYAEELRGRLLVVGAYTSNRREIQCPNEWAPEVIR